MPGSRQILLSPLPDHDSYRPTIYASRFIHFAVSFSFENTLHVVKHMFSHRTLPYSWLLIVPGRVCCLNLRKSLGRLNVLSRMCSFVRFFLFRLLMRLVNSMVCVRSMEDTLEQRPNWAVIALQTKVRLGVSLGEQGSAVIIDARVSQESGS